ncbi:MAG TPA: hypothetical protein PK878_06000 [bacterium]|nr:hypothetical protein [Candidatus Omnitrophota bacterium]HOJ59819.1 hypothetical protein [bacterium]HOL93501.1 hypothetical protein [bacterium]HPP00888.1 hypothetical protein [bacterium]HXK92554.1 hypothetical protein [bacterium]
MSQKSWNPVFRGLALFLMGGGLVGGLGACSSTDTISLKPAKEMYHDVFTCKGLTADGRWVGVTDVFKPDEDSRVVVVTRLSEEDTEEIVHVELMNPLNNVVLTESRYYPRNQTVGIYFSMTKLLELGGEGEWRAIANVNGEPIGQAVFYVGEKPLEEEEPGTGFFVVGEDTLSRKSDSLDEDDEGGNSFYGASRFDNYIREVTPELPIPSPIGSQPSPVETDTLAP